MALNTNEVLDVSKENIQPLRQGRRASHLKTALQAQTDPAIQQQLLEQRDAFEHQIRTYKGDDPLDLYYQYVIWLEQSFPKLGRKLIPLLEDIMFKFKDVVKYKQDPRFVQLMIKYINTQSNQLELYQIVYNQGLGITCCALYKAWAEVLEKSNDCKRANQIYQLGLTHRAQPIKELEDAHVLFQLGVARRMLEGSLETPDENQTSRKTLGKLPSTVKANRVSKDTAGVFQSVTNHLGARSSNQAVSKIKVYEEDENEGSLNNFKRAHEKIPKGSEADRENTMKAGKWAGQKQKQSSKMLMSTTPSFPVHEDPESAQDNVKTITRLNALKTRREEPKCPVAVFEPPDPTKKTMYPKHLVYVGGRDVQLEEIRAADYLRAIEKIEADAQLRKAGNTPMEISEEVDTKTRSLDSSKSSQQPLSQGSFNCSSFNLEQSVLRTNFVKPVSQLKFEREQHAVALEQENSSHSNKYDDCALKYTEENASSFRKDDNNAFGFSCGGNSRSHERNQSTSRNAAQLSISDKMENSAKYKSDDEIPDARLVDKNNTSALHHSLSTSVTIHTRRAQDLIQQMWESPIATSVQPSVAKDESPQVRKPRYSRYSLFPIEETKNLKSASTGLDVLLDENEEPLRAKYTASVPSIPVYEDTIIDNHDRVDRTKPTSAPFTVYCDQETPQLVEKRARENESKNNPFTQPKIVSKMCDDNALAKPMGSLKVCENEGGSMPLPFIVPVNLQDTPLEPENKENYPPKDYLSPCEKRPLTGVLTPAVNVPVRPLDSEDSDDDENDDDFRIHGRRDFDEDTCSTKTFERPLPSSTPFSRATSSRTTARTSTADGSYVAEENSDAKYTPHNSENPSYNVSKRSMTYKTVPNLSLILENSKEQGSSSSSGNNGTPYPRYL